MYDQIIHDEIVIQSDFAKWNFVFGLEQSICAVLYVYLVHSLFFFFKERKRMTNGLYSDEQEVMGVSCGFNK